MHLLIFLTQDFLYPGGKESWPLVGAICFVSLLLFVEWWKVPSLDGISFHLADWCVWNPWFAISAEWNNGVGPVSNWKSMICYQGWVWWWLWFGLVFDIPSTTTTTNNNNHNENYKDKDNYNDNDNGNGNGNDKDNNNNMAFWADREGLIPFPATRELTQ